MTPDQHDGDMVDDPTCAICEESVNVRDAGEWDQGKSLCDECAQARVVELEAKLARLQPPSTAEIDLEGIAWRCAAAMKNPTLLAEWVRIHQQDIPALLAHVAHLTAALQARTNTLQCRDCKQPWSIELEGTCCDQAQRETWPHDWIDHQHRNNFDKLWKRAKRIEDLEAALQVERKAIARIVSAVLPKWSMISRYCAAWYLMKEYEGYRLIMAIGDAAVDSLILQIRQYPHLCMGCLAELTGECPVSEEDRGNVPKMVESWIEWHRAKSR